MYKDLSHQKTIKYRITPNIITCIDMCEAILKKSLFETAACRFFNLGGRELLFQTWTCWKSFIF